MKPHYTKTKLPLYFLSLLVVTTLVSCSTTQSVAGSDDGIYADESESPKRRIIVQDTNKDYKDYNENYFSKELERLEVLNGTDILTDIENYQSEDYEFVDEEIDEEPDVQINYNSENAPWGYDTDTDIVINVNTIPNNRLGWNYNTYWGDPFWDGPLGWNGWGWRWGYNPWWGPYHGVAWGWNNWGWNNWGWNNGFYCPPYGLGFRNGLSRNRWGYYNNRYNRRYINSRNGLAYNRNANRRAISRRNATYRNNRSTRTYRTRRNNSIRNSNGTRTIRGTRTGGVRPTRTGGVRPTKTKIRNIKNTRTGGVKPGRTKSSNVRTRRNYSNSKSSNRSSNYSNSRSSRSSSRSFSSGSSRSSRSFSSGSSRRSSRGRGSSRRR